MFKTKIFVYVYTYTHVYIDLPRLGMLPLLSVVVGSNSAPALVGAEAEVFLERGSERFDGHLLTNQILISTRIF